MTDVNMANAGVKYASLSK